MARKVPSYKVIRTEPVVLPPTPAAYVPPESLKDKNTKKFLAATKPLEPGQVLTTQEIRSRVQALFETKNYNPIKELIDMVNAKDENKKYIYDANFRKELHLELARYYAPTMKAVEITGSMDTTIKIVVQNFSDKTTEQKNVTPTEGPPIDI